MEGQNLEKMIKSAACEIVRGILGISKQVKLRRRQTARYVQFLRGPLPPPPSPIELPDSPQG